MSICYDGGGEVFLLCFISYLNAYLCLLDLTFDFNLVQPCSIFQSFRSILWGILFETLMQTKTNSLAC